jgi:hypothetical protein
MPTILNSAEDALVGSLFTDSSKLCPNTRDLDPDLVALANKTLLEKDGIPRSHLRAHSRLRKILRGTNDTKLDPGEWPNFFTADSETIVINIPLGFKRIYARMSKAFGDGLWSMFSRGSFWGRDLNHRRTMTDLMLPWAFRHELGHSIDYLVQFMNRFGREPEFGGWVSYQNPTWDRLGSRALVQDVLTGVARASGDRSKRSADACPAVADELVAFIVGAKEGAAARKAIEEKIDAVADTDYKKYFKRVWEVLAAASRDPWLLGDLRKMDVVDGRVYSCWKDVNEWHSFGADAYRQRVSNYQFASPSEWFAEFYSARYGESSGPKMYATMKAHVKQAVLEKFDLCMNDLSSRNGVLLPFTWVGVKDADLSPEQQRVFAVLKARRSDGTVRGDKHCRACSTERSKVVGRQNAVNILEATVPLCATCSARLASQHVEDLDPTLCGSCTALVDGNSEYKRQWGMLCKEAATAIPRCGAAHWVPADEFSGLLPWSWYAA